MIVRRARALKTNMKAWRVLRKKVLVRDLYKCQYCGGYGNNVDHVFNDADNASSNVVERLQTLCHKCHSAKTAREIAGRTAIVGADINGFPIDGRWSDARAIKQN